MRLINQELKRIFRPWVFISLILIGCVYYGASSLSLDARELSGAQSHATMDILTEWTENYGTTLEDSEIQQIKESYLPALIQEADTVIAQNPTAKKYNLQNFEDFMAWQQIQLNSETDSDDSVYQDYRSIKDTLYGADEGLGWKIQESKRMLEISEIFQHYADDHGVFWAEENEGLYTQQKIARTVNSTFGTEELWRGMMPNELTQATTLFFSDLVKWLIMSSLILTIPFIVQDKLHKMISQQWASRTGRKSLYTKLCAIFGATLLWSILNFTILGGNFILRNGAFPFFHSPMISFLGLDISAWVNWSYLAWFMFSAGVALLAAIATVAMGYVCAQYSKNHISLLFKLIPLAIVSCVVTAKIEEQILYFSNPLSKLTGIPFIELVAVVLLLIVGGTMTMLVIQRLIKHDMRS